MASILVVGQEQRSLERFHRVLSGEGWRVRLAEGRAQALQAAALEPPDLVVAGADVPGAEELAGAFRRSSGGPGIVVVMTEGGTPSGPAVLGDDRLRQPFGDQDLVTAVRRMLAAGTGAARPVAPPVRLTSQEIFGDVLAEVEGQFGQPASTAGGQASAPPPAASASQPPAPGAGPGPSAQAARPASAPSRADSEIQRKLEKTLSGLIGGDPRSKAAASPAATGAAGSAHPGRRAETGGGAAEIEALLSKTLSELGGARPRHTQPAASPAASARAVAAAPPPASPAQAAAGPTPALVTPMPTLSTAAIPAAAPATGTAAPAPPPAGSAGPAVAGSAATASAAAGSAAAGPAAARPAAAAGPVAAATAASAAGATRSTPAPAPAASAPPAPTPASSAPPTPTPAAAATGGPPASAAPPAPAAPPVPFDRRAVATAAPVSLAPPPPPPVPSSSEVSGAPAGDVAAPTRPGPSAPAVGDATGVRRRLTGEMALSQIEELARTRRKVEPSSRPGLAVPPAPGAAAAGAAAVPGSAASPPVPAPPSGASPLATQRIQAVPRERPEPAGDRFGQYTLLERIAVGGMAEVWKARMRGVEGFQKTVAIKKILPHMTDNADFVGMFIDEAKLAAQLSHPNIIHIYDLGKIGSDFYIAMEYVEGKDLRSLLNAARQRGKPLPLGLALLIAMRLASALDYAHRKRDFEGHVMGLVHRDVSPQNVLISYDGDVKLCDFGIAKAVSKVGQTQMGALKGKLQYMSPEQARGTQVDARSDIFSLGTVLFEMLTGQRLFDGDSEMSVLEAVRQVRVRSPRQVDPVIPREVDELVMHALAGRPEDRFQTAGELEQRLEALLYALKPSPSHGDLAAYVQRVLEPAVGPAAPAAAPTAVTASRPGRTPSSAAFQPAGKPAPAAALAGAAAPLPLPSHAAAPAPGSYVAAGAATTVAAAAAPAPPASPEVAPLAPIGEVRMEEGSHRGRTMLAAAVLALVVAGVAVFFVMRGRNASAPGGAAPATGTRAGGPIATGGNAAGEASPAAAGRGTPAAAGAQGAAARPAAGKMDVQGVVDQEVARRAEELKKKLEDQQKQLQKELDKTKSAKAENGSGTPAGATAAASAAGAPGAGPAAAKAAPTPSASTGSGGAGATSHGQPPPPGAPAAETRQATAEPAASSVPAATAAASAAAPEAARERTAEASGRPPAEAGAASAGAGSASRAASAASVAIVPPKLVSTPKPEYPPLARKLGVQGTVVLQVLVDEQGSVEDVQLLEPVSQSVGINEAAVQVARGARFKPGTRNGDRAKMWTRLRIPFKL
jgi:TonB family protein